MWIPPSSCQGWRRPGWEGLRAPPSPAPSQGLAGSLAPAVLCAIGRGLELRPGFGEACISVVERRQKPPEGYSSGNFRQILTGPQFPDLWNGRRAGWWELMASDPSQIWH